jgi:DNA-binding transcriptional LysR family regulator
MFDLTRLRLLRELAHRGTMTAVGAALGLTSSAVSQQLATLEREARVTLFDRVGRRVRLTSEGERLVAHAEAIFRAVEMAELDLHAASERPRGLIQVACFPSFAKSHLLPAAVRARARLPDLRVIIHELETPDALEAVRDGRCHVAVTFAYNLVPRPDIAGLVSHPLLDEPVLLALPESWKHVRGRVSLRRLAQEDWIVGSRQSDDRVLAERACALAGFAPRITHFVDDYDLVLRMVSAGLGVGFVPELGFAFPSAATVVARSAGGAPLRRRVDASTRNALIATPMVRALLSELSAMG